MADTSSPLLLVDFSKEPSYNIEMTDAKMAKALGGPEAGWTAEKVRAVSSQHGIFTNIPRRCTGKGIKETDCPYSADCPMDEAYVAKEYVGKNCPIEIVEAFKLFSGYVINLDIQPEDFSDLQLVGDLVRLLLLARRCDLYGKDKPIWEKQFGGTNNKTGEAFYNKVPTITFDMMQKVRKDIQDIYKQLIATREAKVKRDATMKDVRGATDLFSQIKKAAASLQEGIVEDNRRKAKKALPEPVLLNQLDVMDVDYEEIKDVEQE